MDNTKKIESLAKWLLLSVSLNIALIVSILSYKSNQVISEPTQTTLQDTKTIKKTVFELNHESYNNLIELLDDSTHVQYGFCKRDFALSKLIEQYFINIDNCLPKEKKQPRTVVIENNTYLFYAGLTTDDFYIIKHYLKTERWPLSFLGLLYSYKTVDLKEKIQLQNSIYLNPEFKKIQALFNNRIKNDTLLELLETDPELSQKSTVFKSSQIVLHEFLKKSSKLASNLVAELEPDFCLKELTDEELSFVLNNLIEENPKHLMLCKNSLISARSDSLRLCAAANLYRLNHQPQPKNLSFESALDTFIQNQKKMPGAISKSPVSLKNTPSLIKNPNTNKPIAKINAYSLHFVKQGETVEGIAKLYKISPEQIKSANYLQTNQLQVGMALRIPKN